MKALSIQAPWWWAILHLDKDIENRGWHTNFRGRILIHASKWYVHRDVCDDLHTIHRMDDRFREKSFVSGHPYQYLKQFGGCVVGSVEIVDCVTHSSSQWFEGKYGFVLRNPIVHETPTQIKGALGIFECHDPLMMNWQR